MIYFWFSANAATVALGPDETHGVTYGASNGLFNKPGFEWWA